MIGQISIGAAPLVTFGLGTTRIGSLEIVMTESRLTITNYGAGIWAQNPSHVPVRSITVALPKTHVVFIADFIGARRAPALDAYTNGLQAWSLIDEQSPRATSVFYSLPMHYIGGGERWDWRFVLSDGTQLPFKLRADLEPAIALMKSLETLMSFALMPARGQYLSRLLKAFTFSPSTVNEYPIRTLGGYVNPTTFKQRWKSNPTPMEGPYHAIDVFAPSEGHTGSHYNMWGWCLLNYLINGDQGALTLGVIGLWRKLQFHLYWYDKIKSERNPLWIDGIWRGEKSRDGVGIRGDAVTPAASKQFDLELVLAKLMIDDPIIDEAFDVRLAHIKRTAPSWWFSLGGGEIRSMARALDSTLCFYTATGDPALVDITRGMLNHFFGNQDTGASVTATGSLKTPRVGPRGPFWTSLQATERNITRPWEAAKLLGAIARWQTRFGLVTFEANYRQSLTWYWDSVRPRAGIPGMWETAYRLDVETGAFNPAPFNNFNPVHNCFWFPLHRELLRYFPDQREKIDGVMDSAVYGMLRNWNDVSVSLTPPAAYEFAPGTIGAAADKINGINASMLWPV